MSMLQKAPYSALINYYLLYDFLFFYYSIFFNTTTLKEDKPLEEKRLCKFLTAFLRHYCNIGLSFATLIGVKKSRSAMLRLSTH